MGTKWRWGTGSKDLQAECKLRNIMGAVTVQGGDRRLLVVLTVGAEAIWP